MIVVPMALPNVATTPSGPDQVYTLAPDDGSDTVPVSFKDTVAPVQAVAAPKATVPKDGVGSMVTGDVDAVAPPQPLPSKDTDTLYAPVVVVVAVGVNAAGVEVPLVVVAIPGPDHV